MKWVTRREIRVNRTATAWLVRRFIDPQAEFEFVDPDEVARVQAESMSLGFDAPGATFPHVDTEGRCSFESVLAEYRLDNSALHEMALIVRGADLPESATLMPESAGLRSISQGFPLVARDDHEILEKACFLYDSLYASIRQRQQSMDA